MAITFVRERQVYIRPGYKEVEINIQTAERRHYYDSKHRRKKKKISCPAQKNLNDKRSGIYLDRLLNANFCENDYHCTLTYDADMLPGSPEEADKILEKFLRRLRKLYQQKKIKMDYIVVNAYRTKKTGEPVRMHHHLILRGGVGRDEIEKLWREPNRGKGRSYGFANCDRIQPNENGLSALAAYLKKQPHEGMKRRWRASIGLKKPTITEPDDTRYFVSDIKKIAADNPEMPDVKWWEKQYPGWTVQPNPIYSYKVTVSELSGASIRVKLRRLNAAERKKPEKKQTELRLN